MYVKDIMTKDLITVSKEITVKECAKILNDNNLSGAPVVDAEGKLIGIVTEGDLIRRVSQPEGPSYLEILGAIIYLDTEKDLIERLKKSMGLVVKDLMTEDLLTVSEDKEIEDAATLLVRNKIKRLPVLDRNNKLVGIISRKDIMNYLYND